jgi:hypothetical protein
MSWTAIKQFDSDKTPKITYVHDGPKVIDARIFFGKFCFDSKVGVLLSEIITCKGGKGYIKWLMNDFPKATDELVEACQEILDSY